MRLFIAVNLPEAIRERIYEDVAPLRAASAGIRWVAAPVLHVTLKFLGEQDERLVGDLRTALQSVAERHYPLAVETTTVGAFPNFRRPRVVWLGMTGENALRALAKDIDQALAPLGLPAETRAFQAHLTLGRVKDELKPAESTALAAAAGSCRVSLGFTVQTVDLMRSELGPRGSRYTVVASVPLHARGA